MAEDLANAIVQKAKEIDESENEATYLTIVFSGSGQVTYDIIKTSRHVLIKKDNIVYKFLNEKIDTTMLQFWIFTFKDLVIIASRNTPLISYAIGWHRKKDKKLLLCDADNKISCERLAQFATLACSPYVTID